MPKKTSAQLDREIAPVLLAAKGSHSAKALATLAQMGTQADQWQLTPIDWVEEERDVPGLVKCPSCNGHKFVVQEGGRVIPRPARTTSSDDDYTIYAAGNPVYDYDQIARKQAYATGGNMGMYGNCPRCMKRVRGWMVPQGKVMGTVRAKVSVGYPRFPPRTTFDSRYGHGGSCHLCNKTILKSGRVPVHGTGSNGVTHGMFVGEDCARKFLDVRLKRPADSIMETGNGEG